MLRDYRFCPPVPEEHADSISLTTGQLRYSAETRDRLPDHFFALRITNFRLLQMFPWNF